MGGVWLVLYFLLDRRKSIVQRSLRALGVGLALFMPSEAFDPHISYKSHFIGFSLGVLFGLLYYSIHRDTFRAAEVREIIQDDD